MKKIIRILSVIMAVVMLAQVIWLPAEAILEKRQSYDSKGALESMTEEEIEEVKASKVTLKDPTSSTPTPILGEVESLREENAKHFRHEDGTYTVALYAEPVHYKAANGKWHEIDNTLSLNNSKHSAAGKATYTPSASGMDIRIPQEFGQSQKITVTKKGYTVGLGVSAQNAGVHLEKTASVVAMDTVTLPEGVVDDSCYVYLAVETATGDAYYDNVQLEESGGARIYNLVENSNFSNAPDATSEPTGAEAYAWDKIDTVNGDGVQTHNYRNWVYMTGSPDKAKEIVQTVPVNAQAGDVLVIGGSAAAYPTNYDNLNVPSLSHKFGIIASIYSDDDTFAQTVEYSYNENDRLSQVVDNTTEVTYKYDYAFYGLLNQITGSDGTKTAYDYDMSGQLSHLTFSKNDEIINMARYTTDEKGNPQDVVFETPGITENNHTSMHYNYDTLGRLTGKSVGPLLDTRTYPVEQNTHKTSNLVSEYANENGDGVALQRYGYVYDLNGNITDISDAVTGKTTTYEYDGLNRLESETINNVTTAYTYDAGGNVNTVAQGSANPRYVYNSNGNWKDQLMSFDGRAITYDDQGNPSTYEVSPSSTTNVYEYTWQRGTQLAGISGNNQSISYAYNASGLRTSKNVDGTTTSYLYSGDLLMRQQTGNDKIDFAYDANGTAIGFTRNGVFYYYLRNLQNDVVAITDAEGNIIAEYSYDAWGNAVASETSVASLETKWLPRFMGAVGLSERLSEEDAEALTSEITAPGIEDKANLQAYIEAYFTAQGTTPSTNISTWIDSTLASQKDFLRSSEFSNFLVNGNIEEIKAAFDPQDTMSVPFCAYFAEVADSLRDSFADVLEPDAEDQYSLYAINSMVRGILRFYFFLLTHDEADLESEIAALLTVTKASVDISDSQSARSALYAMLGLDLPEEEMNELMQKVTELKIYDSESLLAYCDDMNVSSEDVEEWLQNMQISLMNPKKLDNIWSFILASALTDPSELEDDPPALYFSNILNELKELVGETLTTVPELELGGLRVSEMDADTAFAAAILLGELVVMNMDADAIMLLVDILNPESETVTELAAQYAAVAALNPIRYRGYYYDAETGYYFLNTRYYNPEWRRFLNADALFVAGSDAINGSNMYAYCNGNPVMLSDPSGMSPIGDFLGDLVDSAKGAVEGWVSDKVSQGASAAIGIFIAPLAKLGVKLVTPLLQLAGTLYYGDTPWEEWKYPWDGEFHLRTAFSEIPLINLFIKEDMQTNIIT